MKESDRLFIQQVLNDHKNIERKINRYLEATTIETNEQTDQDESCCVIL